MSYNQPKQGVITMKIIRTTTKEQFKQKYKEFEDQAYWVNFRGEPFNWACFCKIEIDGKKYSVKPDGQMLTIIFEELI